LFPRFHAGSLLNTLVIDDDGDRVFNRKHVAGVALLPK
jgi:hypothetical protein